MGYVRHDAHRSEGHQFVAGYIFNSSNCQNNSSPIRRDKTGRCAAPHGGN